MTMTLLIHLFQFPSNGKVYSKPCGIFVFRKRKKVSIPFKRESVLQDLQGDMGYCLQDGFNSLQTGKCIASFFRDSSLASLSSFNSLQTGKCIARSRVYPFPAENKVTLFQFPSNGKVYSKRRIHQRRIHRHTSSFNSLQTGKCIARSRTRESFR